MLELTFLNVWQAYQQLNPFIWWCLLVIPTLFFALMYGLAGGGWGAMMVLWTFFSIAGWGMAGEWAIKASPLAHFSNIRLIELGGWCVIVATVTAAAALGSALHRRRHRVLLNL